MDLRLRRKEFMHPLKAIEKGLLITDRDLTLEETVAVLNEFFIQIGTWLSKNVTV